MQFTVLKITITNRSILNCDKSMPRVEPVSVIKKKLLHSIKSCKSSIHLSLAIIIGVTIYIMDIMRLKCECELEIVLGLK